MSAKTRRRAPREASSPSLLGRGRATAQDVLAWVAALYTASGLLFVMTAEITGDAALLPPETALVPLVGLAVLLTGLALRLPSGAYSLKIDRGRWRIPLYVAGALALPAIAAVQLRRRGQRTSPELWLALPRWVCARMTAVSALSIAASVWSWVQHWPLDRVLHYTALASALACTTILITGLGVRILARRELLLMPTALKVVAERRSLSRQPLLVLTGASAALTLAPLLVAHLWLGDAAFGRAHAEAVVLAEQLIDAAAPGREEELGELLAKHPDVGIRSGSGSLYGIADLSPTEPRDRRRAPHRAQRLGIVVVVPQTPDSTPPLLPFALLALLGLVTGVIAASDVLGEVDDDSDDSDADRTGLRQPATASDLPRTREWRTLGPKIDALIGRTADTAITRYIAEEAVDEADRRRLNLMATVGGDLRPVLSNLVDRAADLHREPRTPAELESLKAIEEGARNLTHALGEIIDMAALADGSVQMIPEPLPVAALLAATISDLRGQAPELQVNLRCAPGMPPVYGDHPQLRRALGCLLAFASQQIEGHPLTLFADYDDGHPLGIRLTIATPKRPMSPIKAGIARRPFHRLAGQPGLGLDLARADAVIRLSNGHLDIQSYGEGMRFIVELPAAAPPARPKPSNTAKTSQTSR